MLALRHLRIGFWGLLVFLTFGLVLEALHGFKIGLYLDVENEPRRLAWRLAHAHGTLLSLVHVVFGLVLGSRYAPTAVQAERASRLLVSSTLLLPGGFFLGGFWVHGGDPGLGVLLVPLGALALFGAVFVVARGLSSPSDLALREIAFGSSAYETSVGLRLRVLREPLGLRPGPEERAEESRLVHLGAFDGERLVACLMLHDLGEGRVRMRQVAVAFEHQRHGVGTRLVHFSEEIARRHGLTEMVLHARQTAVPFYERLGYRTYGEPFVEVTLPHIAMRMAL
jgi:ribosomal protein S18 acetylase RimI-like enzyme